LVGWSDTLERSPGVEKDRTTGMAATFAMAVGHVWSGACLSLLTACHHALSRA
jgi:hypothetical protein